MKLFKKYILRFFIICASVLFLVACDQTTKHIANTELKNSTNTKIAGIIHLQYVENDGGMLSLGSKLPQEIKFAVFILIVSVFLSLLFIYIIKNKQETILKLLALIFILSGGLGNLVDRISNSGKVIDFIRLELPGISTGIFNIADFYVTIGFVMLLLSSLLHSKSKGNEKAISI
jgi:signal peptidase II